MTIRYCVCLFRLSDIRVSLYARYLPFGLNISPAIFQRILANILRRNGLAEFCVNYFDDVLVFSETFDQRIRDVDESC